MYVFCNAISASPLLYMVRLTPTNTVYPRCSDAATGPPGQPLCMFFAARFLHPPLLYMVHLTPTNTVYPRHQHPDPATTMKMLLATRFPPHIPPVSYGLHCIAPADMISAT